MRTGIKSLIIVAFGLMATGGFSQCETHGCDPQLTGFGFNVECIDLNGSATITLGWFMGGGDPTCTAPANSWRIQISLPLTGEYGATSVADITGPGFDWVYSAANKTFTGTNNSQNNWLSGGSVTINVTGMMVNSCVAKLSQANIAIIPLFQMGCPQAFNNQIANDALSSGKGVQTPLPVELTDFNVYKKECNQHQLQWTTASERNSDYMELERSADGQKYDVVYTVKSYNTANGGTYLFTDKTVSPGVHYFYRLKQVDLDGAQNYLKIIAVHTPNCLGSEKGMTLYPNPAFEKVFVSLNGFNEQENPNLVITNAIGETVLTLPKASVSASNEIKLNGFAAGIYTVKVQGDETISVKRFIKVD